MDSGVLKALNNAREKRRAAIVLTDVGMGESRLIVEGDKTDAEFSDDIKQVFLTGKSRLIEVSEIQYFLNVYLPPTRLVVIGAVHISQYLAAIAANTGFDLEIIDPRSAFATPERFEKFSLYAEWPEEVLVDNPLDRYCALIAVTHDPKIDDFAIKAALEAGCFYVGALGSRKTHAKRLQRLGDEGLNNQQLEKIHAPIGLDIGAANPAEIAVAILAEIIGAFRARGLGE